MSLPLATAVVVLVSILTNRILAIGVGLWIQVPAALLLGLLIFIDVIQIPFFYRLYEQGSSMLDGKPFIQNIVKRDWSKTLIGRLAMPLGGFGVMMVAAMPTFGGGIWSATFLAYALKLKRSSGYAWIIIGSLLSYFTLYWILSTLIFTIRYFVH